LAVANRSTSTSKRKWEADCLHFLREGGPFELRDVVKADHDRFCEVFCKYTGCTFVKQGTVVTFTPPKRDSSS
jgi:hypothetical protein